MPDYTAMRYFAAIAYAFPSTGVSILHAENDRPFQWATLEQAQELAGTLLSPGDDARLIIYDKEHLVPAAVYEWKMRPNVPHIMMGSEQVTNTFPSGVHAQMPDILEDSPAIIALTYSLDGTVYAWTSGERLEDVSEFFSEIGHDEAGNPCINDHSALAIINRESADGQRMTHEDSARWAHVLGYRRGSGDEENPKYDWSVYLPPMASEHTHELVQIPLN